MSTGRATGAVWLATIAVIAIVAGCAVTTQRVGSFAVSLHREHVSASTRDAALEAATDEIVGFNTIDYRKASDTVDRWLSTSGGELHSSLAKSRTTVVAQIRKKHTVSSGRTVAAGLTAYDAERGTATVVAVLSVTSGKKPAADKRFAATLARTGGTWRLTGLQAVDAVGAAS